MRRGMRPLPRTVRAQMPDDPVSGGDRRELSQRPMDEMRACRADPTLPAPRRVPLPRLAWALVTLWLLAGALAPGGGPRSAAAQEAASREIRGIELRKDGGQLTIAFVLSAATAAEVVANLPRRVVVVKFSDARPVFPDDKRDFVFNDPYLVGLSFERINERDSWAKLKLRTPDLAYRITSAPDSARLVLGLQPAPAPRGIVLRDVRLGRHRGGSRLVLDVTGRPEVDTRREGDVQLLRLRAVTPRLPRSPQLQDERVEVLSVEQDGPDTLLRVALKAANLATRSLVLPAPPRVVLDFRPPAAETAAAADAGPRAAAAPRAFDETPLETLLARESNPLVTANYLLAEREYQSGNFRRANLLFLRVFDSTPKSPLGVRALFRAADSQYEQNVGDGSTNYHDAIINYQAAIRSAEQVGYETEFIPRAFFQIGRAYQRMGFHFESNVHFQILQERFAEAHPYAPDSYYFQGQNHLAQENDEQAVQSFNEFLVRDGDPRLTGPAHYHLGDAFFNLKRYVEARAEFDKGRTIAAAYPETRPLLIFHMSETYYENAEFEVARQLYRTLLERYPEKSYTKLVGLRLGDFLREEGKEEEALSIYRQVQENAPLEIRLRAMLREGNLIGQRPVGEGYREAVRLYDEIVAAGGGNAVAQEALLRKGLTLQLHGEHQAAVDTLELLLRDFPDGPFSRENLTVDNIEENLKSLVDREFAAERYWEVAKLYTRYRDRYFSRFPFPFTLFQVAQAYQHLGLFDESVALYDGVARRGAGPQEALVTYQKARAYFEKDDLGTAEAQLLKFIQAHPDDVYSVDARMLLGKVYFTGRRYEDALTAYRILVQAFERTQDPQLGQSMAEVYFELGQIYKELGRFKEALDSFEAAVANFHHPVQGPLVPDFVILSQFRVGDMLFELNQDREAIAAYQQAYGRYPEHERGPWARYQMGLIYRRLGEDRKALDEFNTLVELAEVRPGELWESLARQNQRDLAAKLDYRDYLKQ